MFARAKCNDYLCRVIKRLIRKDAGVVDRGGLENRCALAGTQGSNPCLSANKRWQSVNYEIYARNYARFLIIVRNFLCVFMTIFLSKRISAVKQWGKGEWIFEVRITVYVRRDVPVTVMQSEVIRLNPKSRCIC